MVVKPKSLWQSGFKSLLLYLQKAQSPEATFMTVRLPSIIVSFLNCMSWNRIAQLLAHLEGARIYAVSELLNS